MLVASAIRLRWTSEVRPIGLADNLLTQACLRGASVFRNDVVGLRLTLRRRTPTSRPEPKCSCSTRLATLMQAD